MRASKKKPMEAYIFDYEPKALQKGKNSLEDMSLIEAQYNDFLVTKSGYLVVLLKVSGINLDLLTTTEQEDVFDEFNAFLMSTLGENSGEVQQYLDITMPVDFSEYVLFWQHRYLTVLEEEPENSAKLALIASYVDTYTTIAASQEMTTKRHIGQKKMMLYVIIPLMDQSWQSLVNLFFSQLFNELYELAAHHHARLPRNVNFILDEFVNLGKFDNYEEFLATWRVYGIRVATIIQTISQLQDRYGEKKAESILGNCGVKLCLNAANRTTATYFKDLLDKTTVKVDTESESKQYGKENRTSSMSENESFAARDLMTAGEIMQMPADTGIILFQHKLPIQVKKAFQFQLFPGVTKEYEVSQFGYHAKPSEEQLQKLAQAQQAFEEGVAKKAAAQLSEQEQLEKEFFGFEVVEQEVTFESALEELQGEIDLEKQ